MANRSNRITDKKGRPINSVWIFINRLSCEAMKRPDNADLGAFHRALALNLTSGEPDNSEAGLLARELLEQAQANVNAKIEHSEKAAAARWNVETPQRGEE